LSFVARRAAKKESRFAGALGPASSGGGEPTRLAAIHQRWFMADIAPAESAKYQLLRDFSASVDLRLCNNIGTFETWRLPSRMSVDRGRPEVIGRLSKRRF
jgi:hypothetical protein